MLAWVWRERQVSLGPQVRRQSGRRFLELARRFIGGMQIFARIEDEIIPEGGCLFRVRLVRGLRIVLMAIPGLGRVLEINCLETERHICGVPRFEVLLQKPQ